MSDHDQRFKTLLRTFLGSFFELFFPDWATAFDFSRVEWLDKELFSDPPEGRRRVVDLLAKLPTRPSPLWSDDELTAIASLVLIEVESAEQATSIRSRLHAYYTDLRKEYGLAVLPVVVFLRVGLQGIGTEVYRERIGPLNVLEFRFLYVGLPQLDAVEYLERGAEAGRELALALAALMRAPTGRRAWLKAELLERLARSPTNEFERYLLAECVEAYLPLSQPDEAAEFERLLKNVEYQEAAQMAVTTFEKGIEKGIEKGREESREDAVSALQAILEDKFGPLDQPVIDSISRLPAAELFRLIPLAARAKTIAELHLSN